MISPAEVIIRIFLGAAMGGLIGFEREAHGRPAGFRTHLIVGVAGVLIMIVSEQYYHLASQNPDFIRIDPARLAAGAITGVGFLGAGVIVKHGFAVQGLTTAACLWIVSIVGLAIGSGLYFPAFLSTGVTVLALWYLRRLERNVSKTVYKDVTITASGPDKEREIEAVIKKMGMVIRDIDYELDKPNNYVRFSLTVSMADRASVSELTGKLAAIEGVSRISVRA